MDKLAIIWQNFAQVRLQVRIRSWIEPEFKRFIQSVSMLGKV